MKSLLLNKYQLFAIGVCVVFPLVTFGQLQISSITTTPSTCPNNGSITVNATGANPPLLYSIVGGPVTQPAQTNNTFSSLPAGDNYVVQVSDASGNLVKQNVVITGSYVPLSFSPVTISPYCKGNSNGQLIGNRALTTGSAPFTWQLIGTSTLTTLAQTSDTFVNLPAGNYTLRLTDGCNSYQTVSATINDPVTDFSLYEGPIIETIGCDSAWLTMFLMLPADTFQRLPFTYQYRTKNGVYIPPAGSTILDSSRIHNYPFAIMGIQQLVPGIGYGDSVRTTVYDACGDSITTVSTITPYSFLPTYSYGNCGSSITVSFTYAMQYGDPLYGLKSPVGYTFTNTTTDTITDAGTLTGDPTHYWGNMVSGISINGSLVPGDNYQLTVTDGCGKVFTHTYTTPVLGQPKITAQQIASPACLDSVVGLFTISSTGFNNNARLVLLSGPGTLGSTKPGFSYADTYTYPDTIPSSLGYFFLQNLAAGNYSYKIIDDCGHSVPDSFTITTPWATNLNRNFSYQRGCLGLNKLFYSFAVLGTVVIRNIATNAIIKTQSYYANNNSDSVLNVPPGTYELLVSYGQYGYGAPINNTYRSCWATKDTLTILPYQTPVIKTSNYVQCRGGVNIVITPDSSRGVPPYQYEVIAGPQTFPVQNTNIFVVNSPGTYTVRMYDACGNATTANSTVDAITIPPIGTIRSGCNSVKLFYGSSAYYTYQWTNPNGSIYTGDTLNLIVVTPADTGTYHVARTANINGCKDIQYSSYHLALPNSFQQTIPFCTGTMVQVGSTIYSKPGVYSDTLPTATGCDSIVTTTIVALPQKTDTGHVTICVGDSFVTGSHIYTTTGVYKDSTVNAAGCYDIHITDLIVRPIPVINIIPSATTVVIGDWVQLSINTTQPLSYAWTSTAILENNNTRDPKAQIENAVWIYVLATDMATGCATSDSVFIMAQAPQSPCGEGGSRVYIPNAFTPNGDGLNDVFKIMGYNITLNAFEIFNRLGERVFATNNMQQGWDGRYKGSTLPGNYVYLVSYIECDGVTRKFVKGNVLLIR